MFFEDVDLGWRLWLLGYRVRYVPDSLVFHRHHRSMTSYGAWREQYLLERNALFTIFKNYDDENLGRVLPAALMLAVRRGVVARRAPTPTRSTCSGGAATSRTRTPRSPSRRSRATYAIDGLVEQIHEPEPRPARRLQSGATPQRPGDPAPVPPAVPPEHR